MNYLGSQVLRSATVCLALHVWGAQEFGKAEVHKFDVATIRHRENNVFRLQVPKNNVVFVKEVQGLQGFSSIEGHIVLNLFVHLFYLTQKCASFDIFEFEVQILLVLEGAVNFDGERTKVFFLWLFASVIGILFKLLFFQFFHLIMIQLQKSQKSENFSLVYEVINLFHSLYTIFLNNLESNYAI